MDIILGILLGCLMVLIANWSVSIFMNNGESNKNHSKKIWVTFPQFKKEFDKYKKDFVVDSTFTKSVFGKDELWNHHYMHAGIVKVNGNVYYFYTPVGYFIYELFLRDFIEKYWQENK